MHFFPVGKVIILKRIYNHITPVFKAFQWLHNASTDNNQNPLWWHHRVPAYLSSLSSHPSQLHFIHRGIWGGTGLTSRSLVTFFLFPLSSHHSSQFLIIHTFCLNIQQMLFLILLRENPSKKNRKLFFFLIAEFTNLPTSVSEIFDFLPVTVCFRPTSPVSWSCTFSGNPLLFFSFVCHYQFLPAGLILTAHKHSTWSSIWKYKLNILS